MSTKTREYDVYANHLKCIKCGKFEIVEQREEIPLDRWRSQ